MDTLKLDLAYVGFAAAIVVGLIEMVKRFPAFKDRQHWWAPLAVVLGLLVMIPAMLLFPPGKLAGKALAAFWVLHGVGAGLVASGLYSAAVKRIVEFTRGGSPAAKRNGGGGTKLLALTAAGALAAGTCAGCVGTTAAMRAEIQAGFAVIETVAETASDLYEAEMIDRDRLKEIFGGLQMAWLALMEAEEAVRTIEAEPDLYASQAARFRLALEAGLDILERLRQQLATEGKADERTGDPHSRDGPDAADPDAGGGADAAARQFRRV